MKLTDLEKTLLRDLLDTAIGELSNNSCNDLPVIVTFENRDQLRKLIREMNSGNDADTVEERELDLETLAETADDEEFYLLDWVVLTHLRDKILRS